MPKAHCSRAVSTQPIRQDLTDEKIIAAIDNLPANHRVVVLLADVEEFSYRESAEFLQIPVGTVMSRLNRARGHLRESLAGVAPEYGINKPFGKTRLSPFFFFLSLIFSQKKDFHLVYDAVRKKNSTVQTNYFGRKRNRKSSSRN